LVRNIGMSCKTTFSHTFHTLINGYEYDILNGYINQTLLILILVICLISNGV
jgi:hypothetical protein